MKSKKNKETLLSIFIFVFLISSFVSLFPIKIRSEKPVEILVQEKRQIIKSVSINASFGQGIPSSQKIRPFPDIIGIQRKFNLKDDFVSFLNEYNISEFYVVYLMNDGSRRNEKFHSTEELLLNLKAVGDELVNNSHKAQQTKITYKNLITSWNINQISDEHENDYQWVSKSKNYNANFRFNYGWEINPNFKGTSSILGKIINDEIVDIEVKNT